MVGSAARVGAGGVVISDLSKTRLRARAWCDVAPANAVLFQSRQKTIPLCHVAHEPTSRTYGEKKWWVVIVKDQ